MIKLKASLKVIVEKIDSLEFFENSNFDDDLFDVKTIQQQDFS